MHFFVVASLALSSEFQIDFRFNKSLIFLCKYRNARLHENFNVLLQLLMQEM